jgi:hypothetical protein
MKITVVVAQLVSYNMNFQVSYIVTFCNLCGFTTDLHDSYVLQKWNRTCVLKHNKEHMKITVVVALLVSYKKNF